MRAVSQPPELDKAARIKLIKKALTDCGQAVTKEAVARQYYRELRRQLAVNSLQWTGTQDEFEQHVANLYELLEFVFPLPGSST